MATNIEINSNDLTINGELNIKVISISDETVRLHASLIDSSTRGELYIFDAVDCGVGSSMTIAGIELKKAD